MEIMGITASQIKFEARYQRYRFNSRIARIKERLSKISPWFSYWFGAEYRCIGTGGCHHKCTRPPKAALGPFCPKCHAPIWQTSKVNWK